jgi:hypothetical protein
LVLDLYLTAKNDISNLTAKNSLLRFWQVGRSGGFVEVVVVVVVVIGNW